MACKADKPLVFLLERGLRKGVLVDAVAGAAAAIAPPSVPRLVSTRRHCRTPDWRTMARECLQHTSLLRTREFDFLTDIARYRALTPKQAQWLGDIYQRVMGVAA